MQTKYHHLTDHEFVQLHRWDIQGDELVEELWLRLEERLLNGVGKTPILREEDL